jgi:hypothetical protein
MKNKTSNTTEKGNNANLLLATAFSFRQFEWKYYNPPKKSNSFADIVADCKFDLPKWIDEKRDCKIDIVATNYSWTGLHYTATLWWFNRGIHLVNSQDEIKTINECIELANKRMFELCTVFLGGC